LSIVHSPLRVLWVNSFLMVNIVMMLIRHNARKIKLPQMMGFMSEYKIRNMMEGINSRSRRNLLMPFVNPATMGV